LEPVSIIVRDSIIFVLGFLLVVRTIGSAIRTFVLPRSANDQITRAVFRLLRNVFEFRMRKVQTYEGRDQIMALYAPISLLAVVPAWLILITSGYTAMFWAVGVRPLFKAFQLGGASVTTLGFVAAEGPLQTIMSFSGATVGLILVALLIAYLPTMYSAFSQREASVNMLEVRAGAPPSAITMLARLHRIGRFDHLPELWEEWERWFAFVEETHTSLAALAFFRSPQPGRSWVTAAGAVLDAAALTNSLVDVPRDARADLCIRAGYLCMREIASFFQVTLPPIPESGDEDTPSRISITRQEFDEACCELEQQGVPLKADRYKAWRDFAGWRITYDAVLLTLAQLTMAPYAPWSSDRSLRHNLFRRTERERVGEL
jgi:hypothetical protein